MNDSHMKTINPHLKDIWSITKNIQMTFGLLVGLLQYINYVFLYEHFGANANALKLVAVLAIIGQLMTLLSEVPTGVVGDHIGRKKSVVLFFILSSIACFFRAWIFFVPSMISSIVLALIATVFSSVGRTFFSGSFTAWVVDSIRERNVKEGHSSLIARSYSVMFVAKLAGAGIGLTLYLIGYVYFAFALASVAGMLCALYCGITMKETKAMQFYKGKLFVGDSINRMKKILINGFKISIKTPAILFIMILDSNFMTLIFVVLFLWTIAMKSNFGAGKMSFYWYLIVFLSFGTSFLGAKGIEWLSHRYMAKNNERISNVTLWDYMVIVCFMISIAVLCLGASSLMGYMPIALFIAVIAILNIGYGFLMPASDALINHYIPVENSSERATIMSLDSMLLEFVMIILFFPSSGSSGEKTVVGWMIPAGVLIVATSVLHILMRRYQRKIGELPLKESLVQVEKCSEETNI